VALRLQHVLVLMTLILGAGVLVIRPLESHVGATTVGGAIVVELPDFGPEQSARLARRWSRARVGDVAVGATAGAPFDTEVAARRSAQGAATLLLQAGHPEPLATRRTDFAVQADFTRTAAGDLRSPGEALRAASAALVDVLEGGLGVRPLLALLRADAAGDPELAELLTELSRAAAGQPSFRATSIVLLGRREAAGAGRQSLRHVLRLDLGRTRATALSAGLLDDLLDSAP